jgi:hypothetical protein
MAGRDVRSRSMRCAAAPAYWLSVALLALAGGFTFGVGVVVPSGCGALDLGRTDWQDHELAVLSIHVGDVGEGPPLN